MNTKTFWLDKLKREEWHPDLHFTQPENICWIEEFYEWWFRICHNLLSMCIGAAIHKEPQQHPEDRSDYCTKKVAREALKFHSSPAAIYLLPFRKGSARKPALDHLRHPTLGPWIAFIIAPCRAATNMEGDMQNENKKRERFPLLLVVLMTRLRCLNTPILSAPAEIRWVAASLFPSVARRISPGWQATTNQMPPMPSAS